MKIEANTFEELFTASGDQEADLREIDQLIVETAPELKRQLFSGPSITMIGYGEMTWESKASSGVWPLIGVAPQKGNISVYVAAEKKAPHWRRSMTSIDSVKSTTGKTVFVSNGWLMWT